MTSIGNFGEAFAGIVGGLLAAISLRTPFFIQACITFMALPAALMLSEPPLQRSKVKPKLNEVFQIIRQVFVSNVKLRWNTLFSSVLGASTLTMAWFAQPYFKTIGIPVSGYGMLWAVLNLSVGVTALYSWYVEKKLGVKKTVLLFTMAIFVSYPAITMMPAYSGLAALLVFYLARGLATPLLRNYVNLITESEVRATVLSVRNFLIRLIFATTGPFWGWLTDHSSLRTAMIAAGGLYGTIAIITLYFFLKFRTYEA
jgi:MFS family permease